MTGRETGRNDRSHQDRVRILFRSDSAPGGQKHLGMIVGSLKIGGKTVYDVLGDSQVRERIYDRKRRLLHIEIFYLRSKIRFQNPFNSNIGLFNIEEKYLVFIDYNRRAFFGNFNKILNADGSVKKSISSKNWKSYWEYWEGGPVTSVGGPLLSIKNSIFSFSAGVQMVKTSSGKG